MIMIFMQFSFSFLLSYLINNIIIVIVEVEVEVFVLLIDFICIVENRCDNLLFSIKSYENGLMLAEKLFIRKLFVVLAMTSAAAPTTFSEIFNKILILLLEVKMR